MQNIFLIANSDVAKSQEEVNKFKNELKNGDIVVFFNRFLIDLKDSFWIDFIRYNKSQTLLFFSRNFSPEKLILETIRNPFLNKIKEPTDLDERIATYGLSIRKGGLEKSGCICCKKETIYKKFDKIFIFTREDEVQKYYHNCNKDVENIISFIGNGIISKYFDLSGSFSSGFLAILYMTKNIIYNKLYLVGFTHSGGDPNHQWDIERAFIQENLNVFKIKYL